MPITTDYDTFAARYHGSAVQTLEDTPDEFFDALDEFFGTDDGYTHHLSRIYAMKDKIASLQAENEKLNDNDWVIDNHKALKYKIILTEEYYAELTSENEKLKEENSDIKKVRDIKIKRSQDKQQKYIHYKNLVLEHELDDVSDFEDDDYMGFGEKPFRKD